jgi:hypothetical protein
LKDLNKWRQIIKLIDFLNIIKILKINFINHNQFGIIKKIVYQMIMIIIIIVKVNIKQIIVKPIIKLMKIYYSVKA